MADWTVFNTVNTREVLGQFLIILISISITLPWKPVSIGIITNASFKGVTKCWKHNCYICFYNNMCSVIKLTSTERELKRQQENSSRLHSLVDPVTSKPWRVYSGHQVFSWHDQNTLAYRCSPSSTSMPAPRGSKAWILTKSGIEMSEEKPCSFILNCLTTQEQERWIKFLPPTATSFTGSLSVI